MVMLRSIKLSVAILLKNPYLVRLLPVFDDRQHVTGLPRTVIGGLRRMQNLTVNAKDSDLYWGSGR